jgi:non-specific serine/threonine protein kinase
VIGQTLAHYRITAALGAGGMGEVWRATDTKLGREVALKVLPAEFVDDPQRLDRFEREARAVASLNHPHIVTIHSVEEAEGVRFLTMELIEGRSLDKLIPEGGMELGLFLDLATPLAEAISAAHDKSVIHRDLKPPNVMVDADGRLKVLDFGLAKLQEVGDPSESTELPTEALTGIGTVVGTMPYMSPEQIEGQAVDLRTDIFSLGILLFEMAVGERPFQGKSSPALMSSILKDAPTPVVERRSDLPRHLGRIIGRCLEKDRRDRYQTARDVFNELKALKREASSSTVVAAPSRAGDLSSTTTQPSFGSGSTARTSSPSGTIASDEGFWVAVLPFKYTGGDADVTALAEGLTEEIVTGLSRFSYLRVVARGSADRDSGSAVAPIRDEMKASYVMEGSLRQAGARLRLTVQLVDVGSGAHLWAETYDRSFSPESIFELQDDLVPRIVSTVADMHGILPRRMSEVVGLKPADQLTPYEALLHSFGYNERFTPEALAEARSCLERAVEQSPGNADCWAMLSLMYSNEWGHWDNENPEYFEKALQAARKAVQAAPSHSLPYYALAQALFFRREFPASRVAAERAVSLNPMDGATVAFMGLLIAYSGDWERGCALAERGQGLNPNSAGVYHYTAWHDAYGRKDYRRALELALKLNTPENFYQHAVLAMCYAQLGEMDAAHKSLQDMLALKPDYGKVARKLHGKWIQPDLVEQLMEGLSKAGLEIADEDESGEVLPVSLASGDRRMDEGFWVAVLPFKFSGGNNDLGMLAEGLSEDIVTGLSRFSYLRVIARSSTRRYAGEAVDVRVVGEELGARYVMEGSLRQAGTRLRVAVQIVDTVSGAHLWAEAYDRDFVPEELFALQDDLVPRIVSTCADHFGVLARAISEVVRGKPIAEITPYEALMRGFGYHFRLSPTEHAQARDALEQAVKQAPGNADCWAMLSWVYSHEFAHEFNPRPDSLDRAIEAARRAVDLAPSNHLAQQVLAVALFFRKETAACSSACERALALNPLDGSNEAIFITCFTGDWDRGCDLIRRAMELNPHHPRWYGLILAMDEYRRENFRAAVDEAVQANASDLFWTNWLLAAAYGQLGELSAARNSLNDLLAQKEDFARSGRQLMAKWFEPHLVDHFFDGLVKAGLEEDSGGSVAPRSGEAAAKVSSVVSDDRRPGIAVLPFVNRSDDTENEYFSDGLTEELIADLAGIQSLSVISRTSAMLFKGTDKDLPTIGRELGVRYILEGSVRKSGSSLRITAQLVDAETDTQLWSEKFSGTVEDVFEVQERVSREIVRALDIRLTSDESRRLAERPIANARAFELYLQAGQALRQRPGSAVERVPALLAQAIEAEGETPPLMALKAWAMVAEVKAGVSRDLQPLDDAEAVALTLLQRDPDGPFGHAILGFVYYERGRLRTAIRHLEKSLERNPNDPDTLMYMCATYFAAGDTEGAFRASRLMVTHDPLNATSWMCAGAAGTIAGQFDQALPEYERGMALDTQNYFLRWSLGYTLAALGRTQEASRHAQFMTETEPDGPYTLQFLSLIDALEGRHQEAISRLSDIDLAPLDSHTRFHLAEPFALAGDHDRALDMIERTVDGGFYPYPFISTHCPFLAPLRSLPRFVEIVAKSKERTEAFLEAEHERASSSHPTGGPT